MPSINQYNEVISLNGSEIIYVVVDPDSATPSDGYIAASLFTAEGTWVPVSGAATTITSSTSLDITSTGTMSLNVTGALDFNAGSLDLDSDGLITIDSANSNIVLTVPNSADILLNAGDITLESDNGILTLRHTKISTGDIAELVLSNGVAALSSDDEVAISGNLLGLTGSTIDISTNSLDIVASSTDVSSTSVAISATTLTITVTNTTFTGSSITLNTTTIDASDTPITAIGGTTHTITTVAAAGATESLNVGAASYFDVTMDQDCVFSFTGYSATKYTEWTVLLSGNYTPTWPAEVVWLGGIAPTHSGTMVYKFFTENNGVTFYGMVLSNKPIEIPAELTIACSDENTVIDSTGKKVTFRMPYQMTITEVRASLSTPTTAGEFILDIREGDATPTSILSTLLYIDEGEYTSVTAATPSVISDITLDDDSQITIHVTDVADSLATGLKVTLIGTRTY